MFIYRHNYTQSPVLFCSAERQDFFALFSRQTLKLLIILTCQPCTCSDFCSFPEYGQRKLYTVVHVKFPVTFYQAISLLFSHGNISPKIFLDLPSFTYVVRVSSFLTPHCSAGISHTEIPLSLPFTLHMHNSAAWHLMHIFTSRCHM